MPELSTPTAPATRRPRSWLGWSALGATALLLAASFAFSTEEAASKESRAAKVAAVGTAEVARASITERRQYPGELDADAAEVSAFYSGRLVAVHVRVGDAVRAGQVLAELDPVDAREQIAQAQAQVAAAAAEEQRARVEHAAAAEEVARLEPLARQQLISEQELAQQRARAAALGAAAEAAAAGGAEARARVRLLEKRVLESRVRAPFTGRIAARYVDPGAIVPAGARLVRLVAGSPLRVRFQVPEQEIASLQVGSEVRVLAAAGSPTSLPAAREAAPLDPEAGVAARVTGIAGEVRREHRVVAVEALLEAPPASWLPGMYAEAIVVGRALEQATVVPGVAVLTRLQPSGRVESGVFLLADGKARWVPATVLAREGDRVAIESELPDDASVLVAGHTDLADGNPVRAAGEPAAGAAR